MSVWYKQGVYGELQPAASEGRRKVEKLFAAKGEDLYITSIREATHGVGTLHTDGRAWDQRPGKKVTVADMKRILGNTFDVIPESNHLHIEYDPK